MGLPKTVRLNEKLEAEVEDYLKKNNLKFSQLINIAIEKFISEPQTVVLTPANTNDFLADGKELFNEHKDAMDKLK